MKCYKFFRRTAGVALAILLSASLADAQIYTPGGVIAGASGSPTNVGIGVMAPAWLLDIGAGDINTTPGQVYRVGGIQVLSNVGGSNIFVGDNAGIANAGGAGNAFVGWQAGFSNLNGIDNVYIGNMAGQASVNDGHNTFVGDKAGLNSNGGGENTFIGAHAGINHVAGTNNVYVGFDAGGNNANGQDNAFMGFQSGFNSTSTGGVFIGYQAGMNDQTNDNVFIGYQAGTANLGGPGNVFVGPQAGAANAGGGDNVYIGNLAGQTSANDGHNTFVGDKAGMNSNGGGENTFLGGHAGLTHATGSNNVYVGFDAGGASANGQDNSFMGFQAGMNAMSTRGVFIGYQAGLNDQTTGNVFIGEQAGLNNMGGPGNVFVGPQAGMANVNGGDNVYIGNLAGTASANDAHNTFLGDKAGIVHNGGSDNTFLGGHAGISSTISHNNTFVGYDAGNLTTTGPENSFLGHSAGFNNGTGSCNTYLGFRADGNAAGNLTNASAIGCNAQVCANNSMVFGSNTVLQWGFGVCAAAGNALEVGVAGNVPPNGNGAFLTAGGVWTNASDRNLKENITEVDADEILDKVNQLDITRWNYIGEEATVQHIGPMAQDFYSLFNVGSNDRSVSTIDPAGVALVAVKALNNKVEELEAKEAEVDALEEQLHEQGLALETMRSENAVMKSDLEAIKSQLLAFDVSLEQCCINHQSSAHSDDLGTADLPSLEQNIPNPFNTSTTIKYYLPAGVQTAIINLYAQTGSVVNSFDLQERGHGHLVISGNTLAPGTYLYSLIVDGKQIGVKKMILTEK